MNSKAKTIFVFILGILLISLLIFFVLRLPTFFPSNDELLEPQPQTSEQNPNTEAVFSSENQNTNEASEATKPENKQVPDQLTNSPKQNVTSEREVKVVDQNNQNENRIEPSESNRTETQESSGSQSTFEGSDDTKSASASSPPKQTINIQDCEDALNVFNTGNYEQSILYLINSQKCNDKLISSLNKLIKYVKRGNNPNWDIIVKAKTALKNSLLQTTITYDIGKGGFSSQKNIEEIIKLAQDLRDGSSLEFISDSMVIKNQKIEKITLRLTVKIN